MTIFSVFGRAGRGRHLALEQLVAIHGVTSDLRWAMLELAWRSALALFAFVRGRLLASAGAQHTRREEEAGGRHCCC